MPRQSEDRTTQPGAQRPESEDAEEDEWVEVRERWWINGRKFTIITRRSPDSGITRTYP